MYRRDSDRRNAIKPAPLKIKKTSCFMCSEMYSLNECKSCKIYFCNKCAEDECLVCYKTIEIRNSELVKVKTNKICFCNIL